MIWHWNGVKFYTPQKWNMSGLFTGRLLAYLVKSFHGSTPRTSLIRPISHKSFGKFLPFFTCVPAGIASGRAFGRVT